MEWFGWIAFLIFIFYASYPSKVRKLENEVKKFKSKQKGDLKMSKIINELVGKRCRIVTQEFIASENYECTVLDCDDEWIKITYTDKKNNVMTKILRIEAINSIEMKNV